MKFLEIIKNAFTKHIPLKLVALVLAVLAAIIIHV